MPCTWVSAMHIYIYIVASVVPFIKHVFPILFNPRRPRGAVDVDAYVDVVGVRHRFRSATSENDVRMGDVDGDVRMGKNDDLIEGVSSWVE